ncbi:MAG: M28 family peptidase, partial [Planctomycetota bacterium]
MNPRPRLITRRAIIRLAILFALLVVALTGAYLTMIRMPGKSFRGPLPALTPQQTALRDALREDVEVIAGRIGERNLVYRYENLIAAMRFIEDAAAEAGYEVKRQTYEAAGKQCVNLAVEIPGTGRPGEIVVIGGHYDSVPGCPAANDNATGVAATLALARAFANRSSQRTLRFVWFVNEEPPYFQTSQMGSWVYAKGCRERDENIVAM